MSVAVSDASRSVAVTEVFIKILNFLNYGSAAIV